MLVTDVVHPYFYCTPLCPLPCCTAPLPLMGCVQAEVSQDLVHDLVSPWLQQPQCYQCHAHALTTAWREIPSLKQNLKQT